MSRVLKSVIRVSKHLKWVSRTSKWGSKGNFVQLTFHTTWSFLPFVVFAGLKTLTACILILLKWQTFVRTSSDVFNNNFANYYHCIHDPLHCVNWTFFILHNFSFTSVTLITKFDFRAWHKSKKSTCFKKATPATFTLAIACTKCSYLTA